MIPELVVGVIWVLPPYKLLRCIPRNLELEFQVLVEAQSLPLCYLLVAIFLNDLVGIVWVPILGLL